MGEPKRYELNTMDLLQIPEDSFDNFIIDLKKWHGAARVVVAIKKLVVEGQQDLLLELNEAITPNWDGTAALAWVNRRLKELSQ